MKEMISLNLLQKIHIICRIVNFEKYYIPNGVLILQIRYSTTNPAKYAENARSSKHFWMRREYLG